jgi:microcystin-dependent protein
VFDSEDSLIDTVVPGEGFIIQDGDLRWAKIKELLAYTGCVVRWGSDGQFHVFQPTTTGTSYDYAYALSAGAHKFFMKSYRRQLVLPNYITVNSLRDSSPSYSGVAQDSGNFPLLPTPRWYEVNVASNAEAEDVADMILWHLQLDSLIAQANVPMNLLQEVWDYVDVLDSREGDGRVGNIQSLTRNVDTLACTWGMTFSFGPQGERAIVRNTGASLTTLDQLSSISTAVQGLETTAQQQATQLDNLASQLGNSWAFNYLTALKRAIIPHGLDASKETSPKAGSVYSADDTGKFYVCYVDGTWVQVGAVATETSGVVKSFAGAIAAIPAGYLLCNGVAISRTTYAALFTAIGVIWGVGDGSTTFNIPDLRDKFIQGAGTSWNPGDAGGYVNHTHSAHGITQPVMANHSVSAHHHDQHSYGRFYDAESPYGQLAVTLPAQHSDDGAQTLTHSLSTNVDLTNNHTTDYHIPPFAALAFIIKT